MGFFDTYSAPKQIGVAFKPKSVEQLLQDALESQRAILSGKTVYRGKSPVRSWFKDQMFAPKVGQYTLFDKKAVHIANADRAKVLADFEQALASGEFASYIKEVERKRKTRGSK